MKRGTKKTERALMGKEKHRVLIFGQRTCGPKALNINPDFCDVELILFPYGYERLKNLSDYTLVVLDYSAFLAEDRTSVYGKEQEVFEKQMLQASDSGTCFCILHYDEMVPEHDRYADQQGYMDERGIENCRRLQVGFRWLQKFDIRPLRLDSPFISGELRRNEFKRYIDRWGASKNAFRPYGQGSFSDIIVGLEKEYALAFALDVRRGKLIYLPCQRDFSRPQVLTNAFTILVDSLITYLTKSRMELPEWARIPIFDEEEKLAKEKADVESTLLEYQDKLDAFYSAKQLLFQSEYGLEEALPRFLQEQCDIPVEREETYKEDLWLLDPEGNKVVICEVKSYVKGFKKSGLFHLYNHRESYGLDESFPAVLFVNAHLNAASWEQKDRPIDKQDYKEAANKHILILRIEDVLFAWQALREGIIDPNGLLRIFRDEVGWLKFNRDKSWRIVK